MRTLALVTFLAGNIDVVLAGCGCGFGQVCCARVSATWLSEGRPFNCDITSSQQYLKFASCCISFGTGVAPAACNSRPWQNAP